MERIIYKLWDLEEYVTAAEVSKGETTYSSTIMIYLNKKDKVNFNINFVFYLNVPASAQYYFSL